MKTSELAVVFKQIPLLRERRPEDFTITELSGYTNHSIRLQANQADWVLRIPKPATNVYIDRNAESYNQAQAANLELAPPVVWRDQTGLSLTRTLGGRSLQVNDLHQPDCLFRIATAIGRLHRGGLHFLGQVNPGELIEQYYQRVPDDQQSALLPRLQEARIHLSWLEGRDLPLVPSHNDLVLENLLLDDDRLWIIDWEFSSMASPYWDLATLSNAGKLSADRAHELLQFYCANGVQMKESVFAVYRELLQLLSDCWMVAFVPETE